MNSFNTDEETNKVVRTYTGHNVNILTFNQSRFPRILKESHLPKPRKYEEDITSWYPPGHGDVFQSLHRSGLLDALIAQGKEYLFISNIDNLGATVDMSKRFAAGAL
jgi:UTP--glucose-1-phosphate uridylyltransferase